MSKLKFSLEALICTVATIVAAAPAVGQVDAQSAIPVSLDENGVLNGHVFSVLGNEKAPMVADVVLKSNGKVVARTQTNVIGQFSFQDVQPGVYSMQGVSAGFTGGQSIVVDQNPGLNGTAVPSTPLRVTNVSSSGVPYSGQVMGTSSYAAPSVSYSSSAPSFGGGGGGFSGGGFGSLRLGLIGAAVAVPVAIAVSEDDASPAE